jgi:hypothetical protein
MSPDLLHAIKFYDMKPLALRLIERKVLRIFIALKNPSPWPGLKLRPLGPVASILTTTQLRQQNLHNEVL